MKMLKLSLFVLSLFLFVWIFFTQPVQVFASICDGPPYDPACVIEYVPWTHTYNKCTTGPAPYYVETCVPTEVTDIVTRCTIPQSNTVVCQCCYNNGCYLDCPLLPIPTGNSNPTDTPGGPTPTPEPTPPTPYIRVGVINPAGTAVKSKQICGVDCSGTECTKKGGVLCSANDSNFTFPKFNSVNTRLGGRIELLDNLNKVLVVVGVIPSDTGFAETTCNGIDGYCYVWNENSWSTGGRTVDFIVATPTPTPYIRVGVINPAGVAIKSKEICGVDCSGTECTKKGGVYCFANDNTFTFPKFNSVNTRLGGRIELLDNLNKVLVVVGVIPSDAGFAETTCNGIDGYCYVWNENSWSTGGRRVDFIVASPTPTPTPTAVGTITARAVRINATDTSCAAIKAVPTPAGQINNTVLQFTLSSASNPPAQLQSGANYVTFADIITGWYTVDSLPPTSDWIYSRACWTNLTNGTTGEGLSQTLTANQTLQWDIGYTLGTAWLQTQGGDVYASGNIRSFIPSAIPRVFSRDGTGGYPGIVTYGTSIDLDSNSSSNGNTLVSSKNWQVKATQAVVDYYDYFYRRFGAPTVNDNGLFPNLLSVPKPASRAKPYYIAGNMTTTGNWMVTTGEKIVFIVTGNVTIGGKINITGDGFVAFIVKGNIIVKSTVGVIAGSTTSVLDGMYIVSPTGTFQTGLTTAAATARFVGKGMFIAGNFLLERDLDLVGANTASSAELFIYDPQLLFTLPDSMKDTSVSWQEVAP